MPIQQSSSKSKAFSRQTTSQLSLPPLGEPERRHHRLDRVCDILIEDNRPLSATEHLLSPVAVKHPASPSNLSIQFNFEETTSSHVTASETSDLLVAESQHGSTRQVKRSPKRIGLTGITKPPTKVAIEYKRLEDNHPKIYSDIEKRRPNKTGSYQRLTTAEDVPRLMVEKTSEKDVISINNASLNKIFQGTRLKVERSAACERKGSVYGLQEFLSLPLDKKPMAPIKSPIKKGKKAIGQRSPKQTKKIATCSKRDPNDHSSLDTSTYNVAEFLKLPVETHATNLGQRKAKTTRSVRKIDVPSVVVANWVDKTNTGETKHPKKPNKLYKAPLRKIATTENSLELNVSRNSPRKRSTYNIKEFLNLPSPSPNNGKAAKQDLQSQKMTSGKGREYQWDTRLDCHGSSAAVESSPLYKGRQRSFSDVEVYNQARSVSVYNIYEILKDSSLSYNVKASDLAGHVAKRTDIADNLEKNCTQTSPLADRKDFLQNPHSTLNKPVKQGGLKKGQDQGKITASTSTYDLKEFLQLAQ